MHSSNKPFIIAIASLSVVAVCAIGVSVGFGLGAFDNPAAAAKPQAAQSQRSTSSDAEAGKSAASASTANDDSSKAAMSVADSSEASSNSSSSKSPAYVTTKPIAKISLSNSTDYHDMNVFLSNFAEWSEFYRNEAEFDREDYDLEQLVNWAMWHNAINNEGTLVTKTVELAGAPTSQCSKVVDGLPKSAYLRSISTDLIEDTISRYFDIDVDLAGYNSGDGAYYERDGELYEGLYRGDAAMCDNVALATAVQSIGADTVRVDFVIYSGNASASGVSDNTWYTMSGDRLKNAMRAAGSKSVTTQTGTAFVRIVEKNGNRTFKLVSFKVNAPDDTKRAL